MAVKSKKFQNRILAATAVMVAAVAVAMLAFISLELALLAAGFFAAAAFVANDLRRRRFWENGISFRVLKLAEDNGTLNQKVSSTRQDILNIKQAIADINRRVGEQNKHFDKLQAAPRPASGATQAALVDEPLPRQFKTLRPANKSAPTAARAGSKPAAAPPPTAHDAEYDDLSDVIVRELISHAVKERAIDVFVQPIVRLPQRRVRFYEMYARVRARPGLYVPARRFMKLAIEEKVAGEIDTLLLMECLKTIRSSAHVERAAPLFVNISRSTLRNAAFMKSLLTFLSGNRHLAPRLVFELPLKDFKSLSAPEREVLRGLGRLGCAMSLDHVESLDMDVGDLQRHHIRFVKISAKTLMPFTRSDKGRADLHKQKRRLESNGISVIAEKIETENDVLELLDFDISYGQGHLFGRPDLEAAYRKKKVA